MVTFISYLAFILHFVFARQISYDDYVSPTEKLFWASNAGYIHYEVDEWIEKRGKYLSLKLSISQEFKNMYN